MTPCIQNRLLSKKEREKDFLKSIKTTRYVFNPPRLTPKNTKLANKLVKLLPFRPRSLLFLLLSFQNWQIKVPPACIDIHIFHADIARAIEDLVSNEEDQEDRGPHPS